MVLVVVAVRTMLATMALRLRVAMVVPVCRHPSQGRPLPVVAAVVVEH